MSDPWRACETIVLLKLPQSYVQEQASEKVLAFILFLEGFLSFLPSLYLEEDRKMDTD